MRIGTELVLFEYQLCTESLELFLVFLFLLLLNCLQRDLRIPEFLLLGPMGFCFLSRRSIYEEALRGARHTF